MALSLPLIRLCALKKTHESNGIFNLRKIYSNLTLVSSAPTLELHDNRSTKTLFLNLNQTLKLLPGQHLSLHNGTNLTTMTFVRAKIPNTTLFLNPPLFKNKTMCLYDL
jgi:hypothetical protein